MKEAKTAVYIGNEGFISNVLFQVKTHRLSMQVNHLIQIYLTVIQKALEYHIIGGIEEVF